MKTIQYTITDREGIHARPAGLLVKQANKFQSDITLQKDGQTADAKRIFSVMGLAAKQGQVVTVTAEGPDEEAAVQAIEKCLKANL